eukprot:COSAG01_NODE_16916_length_1194_cov_1.537900_2_plen_158_part_00
MVAAVYKQMPAISARTATQSPAVLGADAAAEGGAGSSSTGKRPFEPSGGGSSEGGATPAEKEAIKRRNRAAAKDYRRRKRECHFRVHTCQDRNAELTEIYLRVAVPVRVWVEILRSQNFRIVGKSQSVLVRIDRILMTWCRYMAELQADLRKLEKGE